MYIQDESQRIVGNVDTNGNWDEVLETSQMWTIMAILPEIGAYVSYRGEDYVIARTVTYQEESDENGKSVITTICRILRIDDEGDQLPIEGIEVKATELTLI